DRAALGTRLNLDVSALAVPLAQSRPRVTQTDAARAVDLPSGWQPRAVVANLEPQRLTAPRRDDLEARAGLHAAEARGERVLDQRLQDETRHERAIHLRRRDKRRLQRVWKPNPLDREIPVE